MKKSTRFVEENCFRLCESLQYLWVSATEEMTGESFILCQINLKGLNLMREVIYCNLAAINVVSYRLLVVIVNVDRRFKLFQTMRMIR